MKKQSKTTDPQILNEELKNEFFTINLVHLSVFQLTFVKKVNILDGIRNHTEREDSNFKMDDIQWVWNCDYNELIENIKFDFELNNNMDVCIRIRSMQDLENAKKPKKDFIYLARVYSNEQD